MADLECPCGWSADWTNEGRRFVFVRGGEAVDLVIPEHYWTTTTTKIDRHMIEIEHRGKSALMKVHRCPLSDAVTRFGGPWSMMWTSPGFINAGYLDADLVTVHVLDAAAILVAWCTGLRIAFDCSTCGGGGTVPVVKSPPARHSAPMELSAFPSVDLRHERCPTCGCDGRMSLAHAVFASSTQWGHEIKLRFPPDTKPVLASLLSPDIAVKADELEEQGNPAGPLLSLWLAGKHEFAVGAETFLRNAGD